MPKKIQNCTKDSLISVVLPQHADTYTVISHESVIDMSLTALATAGFTVIDEEYRATGDGNIAQGIYKLSYNSDPELSMMFAWTNSYNKQVRFKCGVGAYINKTGTVMVCGNIGSWARKHTGTADIETQKTIDEQIANAQMYYDQLVLDKNAMKDVSMNKRRQAQMLGILFAEYQILTTEQASGIRQQMDKPSYVFEDTNSLWAFYNYVTIALQFSHPKTWMEDQRVLHYFMETVFSSTTVAKITEPVIEPIINNGEPENQLSLFAMTEEGIEDVSEELTEEMFEKPVDDIVYETDDEGNILKVIHLEKDDDVKTIEEIEEQIEEETTVVEANLDLIAPVIKEKIVKAEDANFDLDFTSESNDDDDEENNSSFDF